MGCPLTVEDLIVRLEIHMKKSGFGKA